MDASRIVRYVCRRYVATPWMDVKVARRLDYPPDRSTVKVVPRPGSLRTAIRPPCASTSCRAMARPKAAPGVNGPGPRGVAAPEAVEDKRQVLRRDALSGVCYLETYSFMARLCPQGDGPAVAGVSDGVRDEVSEDLLESTGVGHDGEGTDSVDGYSQGYSRRLGLATEGGRNVVEEIGNI